MFQLQYLYVLAGVLLLAVAIMSWRDIANPRRLTTGLFWALYGLIFMMGKWSHHIIAIWISDEAHAQRIAHISIGVLVVLMALLAGFGGVQLGNYHQRTPEQRREGAERLGNQLFFPVLLIPVVTMIGVLMFNHIPGLQQAVFGEGNHATLVTLFSITLGCLIGLIMALRISRDVITQPIQETRRLLDSIGCVFILPQLLATLGLLFTTAGIGTVIAHLTESYIAVDNRFIAVAAYVLGIALLTIVMGNAFAAFPIVTAGIGIPILILQHGGNPAVMAAIGMFSGYCGTLMTPMAANFNLVPAALLELPDRNAVIKAQIPTGCVLLLTNVFLLYFLLFL
ncbi:membrane protein [Xenorhabdus sp. GDc328]|nr:membrane protein [Xenorhabdus griffiniae]KOP33704.1 membrane protein [Xenorhabdus sp. GDc328]